MDIGTVKAAGFRGFDGLADDVITRCIESATAEIEQIIAPRKIIAANYTQDYDGRLAAGRWRDELYLEQYPIISVTSVTEDGSTLTLGTGFDSAGTLNVLREDTRGVLRRRPGGSRWARGYQNIRVVYRAGYEIAPRDIEQACIELAILIYKESPRSGLGSVAGASGSAEFQKKLADRTRRVIESYAPWARPRMRAA